MSTKAVIVYRGDFPHGYGEWSWFGVFLVWLVSIPAIPGGWYLIKWMRTLMSLKVELGGLGLLLTERDGPRTILWDNIEMMEEHHSIELRNYGLPPRVNKSFIVISREGEPFSFEENSIKDYLLLARMIQIETERRSIPWTIVNDRF
ncbi:hypothetical protein [Singulisphaera sp. GP187]|uniref:hypothetical protein n=1 Tax=Singulisphaera sp. GP187 TaxID=1882752 RepID=UPI000941A509|nr:hypothetical protein [Singulisphaera sp. GP187]